MDGTLGTGLFIIAALVVFVWYLIKKSSFKERKLNKLMMEAANANSLDISEKEQWVRGVVGIDSSQQIAVVIRWEGKDAETFVFPLREIYKCQIMNENNNEKQHLVVRFKFQKATSPDVDLVLFDSGRDLSHWEAELRSKGDRIKKMFDVN